MYEQNTFRKSMLYAFTIWIVKKKKNKLANMINMTCYLVNRSILIVLEFKTPCEVTSVNTINQIFFIRDNNV
jgi:hypothetical protein